VLALLLDTAVDPRDPTVRHTLPPSLVVNRLAAAGLLVLDVVLKWTLAPHWGAHLRDSLGR
jgi:hypothetical protein